MERPKSLSRWLLGLALVAAGCAGHQQLVTPRAQLDFGVDMARRGLWSEAYFRFHQADQLQPRDPEILNNLAVASEALGKFDEALAYYKQALSLAPGDRDLKNNYDRFVSFYESFRTRSEEEGGEETTPEEASKKQSALLASSVAEQGASR